MSGLAITDVVISLIRAYGSGMDVFNKMRGKQTGSGRHRRKESLTQEELELRDSLRHGPRAINGAYERSISKYGARFASGDSTAYTALAHNLLVLNTGLISIISQALSEDPTTRESSQRSLFNLSEKTAADSVLALNQLHQRLKASSQPMTLTTPHLKPAEEQSDKASKPKSRDKFGSGGATAPGKAKKRPGPDPYARGAWVRSKSGTSVITVGSSKARLKDNKRSTSCSLSHKELDSDQLTGETLDGDRGPRTSQSRPASDAFPDQEHGRLQSQHQHPPDELFVRPEAFAPPQALPPLASRIRHPRPPSVATFQTASTKLGEIPQHKWLLDRPARPWEEAEEEENSLTQQRRQRPLPYVIPPPLEEPNKKKSSSRGFKFWKSKKDD